jgi:antitoxin component HigA of HigAB toxin-antitoxin module
MSRVHASKSDLPSRRPDAVDALQRLIEAQDLSLAELDRMLGEAKLSRKILRRERQLRDKHLVLIGRHLHVAPELVLSLAE